MPVAAVPNYLGLDFKDASPGMRFGMYLPIWTDRADQEREVRKRAEARSREGQEIAEMLRRDGMGATVSALRQRQQRPLPGLWDKNEFAARDAWKKVTALTPDDRTRMKGLLDRQCATTATLPDTSIVCLGALATAPFTTGLGNEHPLENGFAFLNPYGLPYLPGSGVKGVLRQAARERASGEWGDTKGWSEEKSYPLLVDGKPVLDSKQQPVVLSILDVLFGPETLSPESDHVRGALSFWDVIPQIEGNSLMVEIMTPHQGHYYQWKKDRNGNEIEVSPHESGQPTPISFLTVPPKSRFVFHVVCDLGFLERLAPDLARDGRWKELLRDAFKHAFEWLGFGAKTAVGYGAMKRDEAREAEEHRKQEEHARQDRAAAEAARLATEKEAARAKMDPVERSIHDFLDNRPDKNQPEISAVIGAVKQGRWQGEEKMAVARWLKSRMQATKGEWKETSQAKRPERDREYQNTLLVMEWLKSK